MGNDALQSLMSAKVFAEYDRIRKNDGGDNPDIVDSKKGYKELSELLSGVRKSCNSTKNDITLLKALLKCSEDFCEEPMKKYNKKSWPTGKFQKKESLPTKPENPTVNSKDCVKSKKKQSTKKQPTERKEVPTAQRELKPKLPPKPVTDKKNQINNTGVNNSFNNNSGFIYINNSKKY